LVSMSLGTTSKRSIVLVLEPRGRGLAFALTIGSPVLVLVVTKD